jgi:integrase
VKPQWDGRLISSITRRDVLDLIDGIADRGALTYARRASTATCIAYSAGRSGAASSTTTPSPIYPSLVRW